MPADVVIVGSGPNGLAAAVTLARAGLDVRILEASAHPGGGARTLPLGDSGLQRVRDAHGVDVETLLHEPCSAVHPLALASPFFRRFDLAGRGVALTSPPVSYAHPLDDGAVVAHRDLARTVDELGAEGHRWSSTFRPLVDSWQAVASLLLGDRRDILRPPAAPAADPGAADPEDARGSLRSAAAALAQSLITHPRRGRSGALLAGVSVHAMAPLSSPAASGTGLLLGTLAHAGGWPVPLGGSGALTSALLADLAAHGVTVETSRRVSSWDDLPAGADVILTTDVPGALRIVGNRLQPHVTRALRRFRHGPGVATVSLVLDGPVPWRDSSVAQAGTVHVGGSVDQMRAAQAATRAGQHAERPIVLLGDPALLDSGRAHHGARVVWAYAHVPYGSTRDVTTDVLDQVERFAPDVRDRILATRSTPAARLHEHDANLTGGDIAAGAVTAWQMIARPRIAWDPHHLGTIDGRHVQLGSSATPPGPGVHGMGGYLAARSLLRRRGHREGFLGVLPPRAQT